MSTVGQPWLILPPCTVGSPTRAASRKLIHTVGSPRSMTLKSGHTISSATRAAGNQPTSTSGLPFLMCCTL